VDALAEPTMNRETSVIRATKERPNGGSMLR
jgi:hypothetical protein